MTMWKRTDREACEQLNQSDPMQCTECGHLHFIAHMGAIRAPFGHYEPCPIEGCVCLDDTEVIAPGGSAWSEAPR